MKACADNSRAGSPLLPTGAKAGIEVFTVLLVAFVGLSGLKKRWLLTSFGTMAMALFSLTASEGGGGGDYPPVESTDEDSGGGSYELTGEDVEAGYEYQKNFCPEHDVEYVNGVCPICNEAPQPPGEYYSNYSGYMQFFGKFMKPRDEEE